jgi:hypothetical protein
VQVGDGRRRIRFGFLFPLFLFFVLFFFKPKQIRLGERSEQKRSEARVRSGGRVGLETLFFCLPNRRKMAGALGLARGNGGGGAQKQR